VCGGGSDGSGTVGGSGGTGTGGGTSAGTGKNNNCVTGWAVSVSMP
jgi:hypothetical protein